MMNPKKHRLSVYLDPDIMKALVEYSDFGEGPAGQRLSPTVHVRANGKALVAWCDGSVTAESKTEASAGDNPHGGDADQWNLGWCGPEANNGWWNPRN